VTRESKHFLAVAPVERANVQSLLDRYQANPVAGQCSGCAKNNVITTTLTSSPSLLVVKINRFINSTGTKNTAKVAVEASVQLSMNSGRILYYDLFAVVEHVGTEISSSEFSSLVQTLSGSHSAPVVNGTHVLNVSTEEASATSLWARIDPGGRRDFLTREAALQAAQPYLLFYRLRIVTRPATTM
jgi:hypothetical protein